MEARPVPVAGGSRWTTLSAGSTAGQGFTCGVTIAGEAYCWGNNWLRQLGTGSLAGEREHTPAPVAAPEGVTWTRVSAGIDSYACALAADGDGYCWGQEHGGRLGVGSGSVHAAPTLVAGGHTWLDISAGSVHSCGITTDGDAYCWGGNSSGQLGNGAFSAGEQRTPAPVVGEHKWTAIVTGDRHTCGITVEGDAYCWGANGQGTAGIGQTSARLLTPAPVAGGLKWRSLTAGTANTCGVTVAGAAYCWGANQYGQVGQGTTSTSEPSPTPVAGGHAWAVLSAGQWHVCGATLAGAAYCWGRNTFGTLGIGGDATAVYPIPTEVVASH